jgi:competence protein ComEC
MVLDPRLQEDNAPYRELRAALLKKKLPLHRATEGQQLNLKDGVKLAVLNPPDPRLETDSPTNDNSVVMRLTYEGFSMLFAGDVEQAGAQRLARLGEAVHSTVLKAPHHGSGGIVGTGFVKAVHPALAVISVGAHNTFGHPSDEVLGELARVGARVLRTDQDGAITIRVRPPRWWAKGHLGGARARKVSGAAGAVKEAR